MKYNLSEHTLMQLSEFISTNLALNFPKERWDDLTRNITSASKEFGFSDIELFIQHIISTPLNRESIENLASNLTINETYFWREPQTFEALTLNLIPELIRRGNNGEKRIRIWSAGCSSGEEPYSIAIALDSCIPDIQNWNISILATDINNLNIMKAKAGIYGQWSFRGTPLWLKEKYFIQKPANKFELISSIKAMVRFEYLNLSEDIYPSTINGTNAIDIIFCRNVLMYFNQDRFRQIARRLYNSLCNEGYLIVSASELSIQNFPDYQPVKLREMILYQKSDKQKFEEPLSTKEKQLSPVDTDKYNLEYIVKSVNTESENFTGEGGLVNEPAKPTIFISNLEEARLQYKAGNYSLVSEKLQQEAKSIEEHILLIEAMANLGQLSESIKYCERAISLYKTDPGLHYLYSTILLENNQTDEAIRYLKNSLYLDPDFLLSYYSLGNIYSRQGRSENSKKCYTNILSILNKFKQDDILFDTEGMTAGRFKAIVSLLIQNKEGS